MERDYEVALSYAHKDGRIAEIFKRELKNIFADRFFMDVDKPEELTNAGEFEEKLRIIFQRTNYPIILYSENYCEGQYTSVEKEEILKRASREKEPHLFIININDYDLLKCFEKNLLFMSLDVLSLVTDELTLEKRIHDIIHNQIKKFMMKQSIKEIKEQREYAVNVQTLFIRGMGTQWKTNCNWNLLGTAYLDEDGRRVKEGTTWQELWQYIEDDFLWIKEHLEADITRKIYLNCHLSIAYKLGQIYGDLGQASGNRNLVLLSGKGEKEIVFTFDKKVDYKLSESISICQEYDGNNCESEDIACIVSIKPGAQENILETVKCYMEERGIECRKVCLFQKKMYIEDANMLENIAEYLRNRMSKSRVGHKSKIHLFPDTTAPLMFVMGAKSIVSGKIQLYEYIPEEDSYEVSLMR